MTFTPITSTSPASNYWGIDQDLTYGEGTTLLSGSAGIVDTGTTLLYIPTAAYDKFLTASGGKLDSSSGVS